jgi:hypothetical protein
MKNKTYLLCLFFLSFPLFAAESRPPSKTFVPVDRRDFFSHFNIVDVEVSSMTPPSERMRLDARYRVYVSTATPPWFKQSIEREMELYGQMTQARRRAKRNRKGAALIQAATAADASFRLGEVYAFPNPAKGRNPTFHMEAGVADRVELRVFDVSGRMVHHASLTDAPGLVGGRYAYEYLWDAGAQPSGIYVYVMTAWKDGQTLQGKGKCALVK